MVVATYWEISFSEDELCQLLSSYSQNLRKLKLYSITLPDGTWTRALTLVADRFGLKKLDLRYLEEQGEGVNFKPILEQEPYCCFENKKWCPGEPDEYALEEIVLEPDDDLSAPFIIIHLNSPHMDTMTLIVVNEKDYDRINDWLPIIEEYTLGDFFGRIWRLNMRAKTWVLRATRGIRRTS
ncbi:hypothetical protein K458DRAFT_386920 [Lentithecium fluviatile CBS 122367]|uniref:Uncharacterized protein n=1 Tax=Lentithecium fluviatile CBS 122367 TaxID=1168545 RepID=A0A6G1J8W3_9PLEO|nr:hypothetical protein K458DRAFT_386920 [Lentithecium fluviatile CBS 122367]